MYIDEGELASIQGALAKLPADLAVGFGRVNGHINHINLFAGTPDGRGYAFWMQIKPATEENFALCEAIINALNGLRAIVARDENELDHRDILRQLDSD